MQAQPDTKEQPQEPNAKLIQIIGAEDAISDKIYRNEFTIRNSSNELLEKIGKISDKLTECSQFQHELQIFFQSLCNKDDEMEHEGTFIHPTDIDGNRVRSPNEERLANFVLLKEAASESLGALLSTTSILKEVEILLTSHEAIRMEYDKLRLDNNDLVAKHSKMMAKYDETVAKHRADIKQLRESGSDAEEKLRISNEKYWTLKKEFEILKERLSEERIHNDNIISSYKEAEEKSKALIEDLNVENTKFQHELKMATTLAKGAKEEINKAIAEKNVAVDELKELQFKYKKMKDTVLNLKNSLRKTKTFSASQMSNSFTSQTNSLIGTLVSSKSQHSPLADDPVITSSQISLSIANSNRQMEPAKLSESQDKADSKQQFGLSDEDFDKE